MARPFSHFQGASSKRPSLQDASFGSSPRMSSLLRAMDKLPGPAPILTALILTLGLVGTVRAADVDEKDDDNFREDVLLCEEALAHARSCCPALTTPYDACRFYHRKLRKSCGCSRSGSTGHHSDTWPALKVDESEDILEASCDDLRGKRCDEVAVMF